jgi:signal transduction histidine kinase
MSKLNLSDLVEEAVLPFEAVYFEAGKILDSQIDPDIHMTGSDQYLRHLMEILLDNGCKYSNANTTVTLRLTRQNNHKYLLSVRSYGQNLTEKQCQDIFKRFYRLDAARKMNHSYGLGLSIAQTIVEAHRGRIWCESKNGENTFYVSFPVS